MTKFEILSYMIGKEIKQIMKSLWDVLSIFGVSKNIQSDCGTDFVNQLIKEPP